MTPAVSSTTSTNTTNPTPTKTAGVDDLANKDTFLKLLVAQMRNQNPLNPTDGVQFVSQLAQFSSLEQNVQMSSTLDAIRTTLDDRLPAATTTAGSKVTP